MKILLTGADGFVGGHAYRRLSVEHQVVPVSRRRACPIPNAVSLDLTEQSRYELLPTDVEAIVHLAQSRHHRAFPARVTDVLEVNVNATLNLAQWGRAIGVRRFLFSSSANVYAPTFDPVTEKSPTGPDSFYGATKYAAEVLLAQFSNYFQVDILRLFTVFGPGQTDGLVPQIYKRLILGLPVSLHGVNGLALSPIYVDDVVEAFARILSASEVAGLNTFNLCGDTESSVRVIGETLADLLTLRVDFDSEGPVVRNFTGDGSLFRSVYGLKPETGLRQGLHNYLAWRQPDLAGTREQSI